MPAPRAKPESSELRPNIAGSFDFKHGSQRQRSKPRSRSFTVHGARGRKRLAFIRPRWPRANQAASPRTRLDNQATPGALVLSGAGLFPLLGLFGVVQELVDLAAAEQIAS